MIKCFCQLMDGKKCDEENPVVALMMPPSFERIAAMLGLFVMGMAYLPLDSSLPEERVKIMLEETNVNIFVTRGSADLSFRKLCDVMGVEVVSFDKCLMKSESSYELVMTNHNNPLIGVLYTSGSTGMPKGVGLTSSNICNRLLWYWKTYPFEDGEVCCHKTSLSFVDSLTEILSALLKGIPLVIVDKGAVQNVEVLIDTLHSMRVSRLVLVPSLLKAMVDLIQIGHVAADSLHSLRYVVSSGECLGGELAKSVLTYLSPGRATLLNLYGSTETTGDITCESFASIDDVDKKQNGKCVSLGRPIDNCNVYVLDEQMRVVEDGRQGEICVSGPNVCPGYTHSKQNPVADRSNFVFNTFSADDHDQQTLYRMGDLGRLVGGYLYYEGRIDSQVKIRGQRVDLLEIETTLEKLAGIQRVVVLCCELEGNDDDDDESGVQSPWTYAEKIPVAFVKGDSSVAAAEDFVIYIKSHCSKLLPTYLIPEVYVVDGFPLQEETGKVDRQALQKLFLKQTAQLALTKTNNAFMRTKIMQALSHILVKTGREVDICKSFFENGGSSLEAVSLVVALSKIGVHVKLTDFLRYDSIQQLLDSVNNEESRQKENSRSEQITGEQNENYYVELINNEENKEEIIDIIGDGFAAKSPIDVLVGSSSEQCANVVRSIWDDVINDQLSFAVWAASTRTLVAVCIICDVTTQLHPVFEKEEDMINRMQTKMKQWNVYYTHTTSYITIGTDRGLVPEVWWRSFALVAFKVGQIIDDVEKPVRSKLPEERVRWIDSSMMAVHPDIRETESLKIIMLIEQYAIAMATKRGYSGIITVNSHPATAMMAESQFGYTVQNQIHVKSYNLRGEKPFEAADKDYYIKCMTKELKSNTSV